MQPNASTPDFFSNSLGTTSAVTLPRAHLRIGAAGMELLPSADHESPEPATIQFNDVPLMMADLHRDVFLPGAPISGDLIVQSADGKVTYEVDVHYKIDNVRGCLYPLEPLTNKEVRASGSYTQQRIDIVTYDHDTQDIQILRGRELHRNPETGAPRPSPSQVPIFRILRTKDYWEASPLHLFDDGIRRDMRGEILSEIERSRRHLAPIAMMAGRNEEIRIAWTGDSIVQMGRDSPKYYDFMNNNANGPVRDEINYWSYMYSPEQIRQIPQYRKHNGHDIRRHTEGGYVWPLVHRLREIGAQTKTFNCGINGTYSGPEISPVGKLNQSHPDRLALYASLHAQLFIVATGQNELGRDDTRRHLFTILEPRLKAGAYCIIITPPLRNETWRPTRDAWRKTCAIQLQAARDLGCACVYSPHVLDDGFMGANGLTRFELGQQFSTHPGLTELGAISGLGCKIIV